MTDTDLFIALLYSLGVGLLIGIERGWSGRLEEEGDRVAGIRTFSIVGLLGGVTAHLGTELGEWIVPAIFIAVAALIIVAYLVEARENEDIGTTTAFSMMATFLLAVWASLGFHIYALGAAVIVVALLSLKPILHRWVWNMETHEIYAGIKLLIISVILLPLLPNEGMGPWDAFNPRWVWWMVVLICGISFVGYFAIKFIGSRMGTLVTALTGGLASSTAVTLSMAQLAKSKTSSSIFMAGAMVASSIMLIRVSVEVAVVNASLLYPLWIPLLVMFLSIVLGGIWLWYRSGRESDESDHDMGIQNPFRIAMALKFGLILGVILVLAAAMKEYFGSGGVYLLSLVSGLLDVDAITLSLSLLALEGLEEEVAVMGIILATVSNTIFKGLLFAFISGFRKSIPLIILMTVSGVLGLLATALLL
ncbi:MAG: MgtC/SapB family protein [Balneolaceae bacterium]